MSSYYNNNISKKKQISIRNKNNTNSVKNFNNPKNSKKSYSLKKNDKISDIITQVKPTSYIPNFITNSSYNINNPYNQKNKLAFTPINKRKKLFSDDYLLPQKSSKFENKKTLVLDIDETLVHSSFIPFTKNDLVLNVNFDGIYYNIYVLIRPWAEQFIKHFSKYYEIITFTASIPGYASPLLDILDKEKNIQYRLYREHCTFVNGMFIKDLKRLNRNLKDIIIVDNSPLAYAFDSDNGLPILSWFDNPVDRELINIQPLLEFLSNTKDVRKYIKKFVKNNVINYEMAHKVIKENESKLNNDMNKNNEDENKQKNINNNENVVNSNENDINIDQNKLVNNYFSTKKEPEMPLLINNNIKRTININKQNYLNIQKDIKYPELDNNVVNNKNNNKLKNKSLKKKNVFKLGTNNSNTKTININQLINSINIINKNKSIDSVQTKNKNLKNVNINCNSISSLTLSINNNSPNNLNYNNKIKHKNNILPLTLKEITNEKYDNDKELKNTNMIDNFQSKKKFNINTSIKLKLKNNIKETINHGRIPSSNMNNNIISNNLNNVETNINSNNVLRSKSTGNFLKLKNSQQSKTPKIQTAKIMGKIENYGNMKWFNGEDNKNN